MSLAWQAAAGPCRDCQRTSLTYLLAVLQSKGLADAGAAAFRVSGLEVGGLFGSLLAGRISDSLIARSAGKAGAVGKRVQVQTGCCVPAGCCLPACRRAAAAGSSLISRPLELGSSAGEQHATGLAQSPNDLAFVCTCCTPGFAQALKLMPQVSRRW